MESNQPSLTPATIIRLQQSYREIAQGQTLAPRFYARLFERYPEVRALFPDDMARQHAHFTVAMAVLVTNLAHLDALAGPLRELGARHVGYGVRREHYVAFRDTVLDVMAESAGERWSLRLRDEWWEVLTRIITIVLDGAPDAQGDAIAALRAT